MRILITGITGYIGSHLARELLQEHEVFGLVRDPIHTEYLEDIQERLKLLVYDGTYESMESALQQSKPDLIYHLATYYTGSHDGKVLPAMLAANITLGAYLLEAMTKAGCKNIIYASTVMEYYQTDSYCPVNLYAATKRAFSDLMYYYADAGWIRTGILVLSDTYGPDDHRPKILNLIQQHIDTEQPIALSQGNQQYAVVYIDDVVRAFIMAGSQLCEGAWNGQIFQVLPQEILTLRQTVEKMMQIHGGILLAEWGKRPAAVREMEEVVCCYPCVPGWSPQVSLDIGLRKILKQEEMEDHE